jgi:TonB family protein
VVEQALLEAPEFNIQAAVIGDPFGTSLDGSRGRNGLLGIGDRPGGGIGDQTGDRQGGTPEPSVTRITRGPQVIYKEEPEYSDEARKAHFQGTVVLAIEVSLDGRATGIRVVRSAGLGLDERAIEAVRRWRFVPAFSGDHAVVASAVVEVGFHLL